MDNQIKVLYSIFELELAPPFRVEDFKYHGRSLFQKVLNRREDVVASYNPNDKWVNLFNQRSDGILDKIKQVFGLTEITDDEVLIISNHLYNWLVDKFPEDILEIIVWNRNSKTRLTWKKG